MNIDIRVNVVFLYACTPLNTCTCIHMRLL